MSKKQYDFIEEKLVRLYKENNGKIPTFKEFEEVELLSAEREDIKKNLNYTSRRNYLNKFRIYLATDDIFRLKNDKVLAKKYDIEHELQHLQFWKNKGFDAKIGVKIYLDNRFKSPTRMTLFVNHAGDDKWNKLSIKNQLELMHDALMTPDVPSESDISKAKKIKLKVKQLF